MTKNFLTLWYVLVMWLGLVKNMRLYLEFKTIFLDLKILQTGIYPILLQIRDVVQVQREKEHR